MTRCKMVLQSIKETKWSKDSAPSRELTFACQYDPATPEDQRFQKATPTGTFTTQIDNPAALAMFEGKQGHAFFFDITPAE